VTWEDFVIDLKRLALLPLAIGAAALTGAANAQSILDTWKSVPVPPAPELQPVTVDAAHSALLILDMYATSCSEAQRPRCVVTIPHVQHLLADARAHKMMVIYSAGPPAGNGPTKPTDALAQLPSEPTVRAGADKFLGSDLEKLLTDGGIKTVIVVGTSADGAVLYTASHAAQNNLDVVVPVDGMSSVNPFSELYTAWHLKNTTGSISRHVTLTKADMVTVK
jgi:nicotinamidase-related amidase